MLYIKKQKPPEISDIATVEFYSDDNTKFFELNNNKKQTYVPLSAISSNMVKAILSVEDQHFYRHSGFDYQRIVKSIIDNVISMKKKYGASTITQQYARNLYLNQEKSLKRKLKEAYYTVLLESNYTKDQILEGYLNTIYFGHGIYGVADAAKFYFGVKPEELTIAQAAVLAAIPKAPSYYSPLTHFEKNKLRKELILDLMFNQKTISKEEYAKALNDPIHIVGKHPEKGYDTAPYFQDLLLQELEKYNLAADEFFKGIKVYTTLNLKLNTIAEQTVKSVYSKNSEVETAVYAIDPQTGFVKTVIGGRSYGDSQYNRATSGKRHSGSAIKPILYYSALDYGFTPITTLMSAPTVFYIHNGKDEYAPNNFGNRYAGQKITMAYAIAISDNIYAVKTHLFLGENTLVTMAHRLDITSDMKAVPSLALGSSEIKLSELTTAYAHFASLGKQVKPVYITKITDFNDNVIYQYKPMTKQLLNPDLCFILNDMLNGMFDTNMSGRISVTGQSVAALLHHKYAAKSGSTDFDSVMVGFNPELAVGVWTGYDDARPMKNDDAESSYSKLAWALIMENYFRGQKTSWYEPSNNIVGVRVNPLTGIPSPISSNVYTKTLYFIKGTEPPY